MEVALIFPHQLFEQNPILQKGRAVFLLEEHLFFLQYAFHKQKLTFHRAAMKHYQQFLLQQSYQVSYVDAHEERADIRHFLQHTPIDAIHLIDPVDDYLLKRIKRACAKYNIKLHRYDSPAFINTVEDLKPFFSTEKKKFFQTEFYIQQRKSLKILLDPSGKPLGGKWSFDNENRKKYPTQKTAPAITYPAADPIYKEARSYVLEHFPNNPGEVSLAPYYPFTFKASREWLQQFLEYRFAAFGDYEDAIQRNESILHHSVLSPLLNSGLLTPQKVVEEILLFAEEHNIAINNTEGIIRQIIGWREFIRGMYLFKGVEERSKNFWGFSRKIPPSFYTGETGIEPIDTCIKKALKTGYNHHIERLMVLGNFMLLCEFDPDEVYRWFMELYIDAYDWVMVPNVYGMSQFSDGGLMATKPYISSSNYLMKMSNFRKGEWQEVWDGLFWHFMHSRRDFFSSNPRLGMLLHTFDKMEEGKKNRHLSCAENFLATLV